VNQPYHDDLMLQLKAKHRIDIMLVALFGYRIGKPVLDAYNNHVYIVHPVRPLEPDATHIPNRDRGAGVIRRIVKRGRSFVPMQVVLIRAEDVKDPKDPTAWDSGEVLIRSRPFYGPQFSRKELGPSKKTG
jgi:hypothetical protein